MSTHDPSLPIDATASSGIRENSESREAAASAADSRWQTLSRRLAAKVESAGEWLNPLLVKEVRQALKSRQFSFWFALVLAAAWIWSIAEIIHIGPAASFGANGPDLFYGYYLILAA